MPDETPPPPTNVPELPPVIPVQLPVAAVAPSELARVPPVIPPPAPVSRSPGLVELGIGVAIIWGADITLGLLAGGLALATGQSSPLALQEITTSPAFLLGTSILSAVTCLAVAWYLVCRRFERPWREGFAFRSVSSKTVGWSVLLGVLGAVAAFWMMSQFATGESVMAKLIATPSGKLVMTIIALTLPITEEIYYRGFLYPILARYLHKWAVPLVALWFAGAHAFQLAGDWIGLPVVFCMGLLWTWQRHRTGSLVPGLITHWVYNLAHVAAWWVIPD